MNRSEILMVITLIVSLTTLWFSWKLYSEKNKKVCVNQVENFCPTWGDNCGFLGNCCPGLKCVLGKCVA